MNAQRQNGTIAASDRPLVVWVAGVSWGGIAGTDRQMVSRLTPYADILWVDPPVSPVTAKRFLHGASRRPLPTLDRINETIFRLSPKALPLHTRGAMRGFTARLMRLQIRSALRRIGRAPKVVVASHLDNVLGTWGTQVLNVFYGTDDFVGGAELMGTARRRLEMEEKAQLLRADLVVAISTELADRWRSLGFTGPMTLVPNGVNVESYREIDQVTSASISLPRPVAGFVGHLSSRIDISLLESVVDAGCSLLLVGPHDPLWEPERFRALVSNPRVSWVGPIAFEKLPSYLKLMDVGITPYADTQFNRASFPLKTLEYLAAGKPVVSTDLPAVRWLDTDLIRVAGHRDFGEVTLAAGSNSEPGVAQRRFAFADSHSWERRAKTFAEAIGIAC
jgi:teichuronic acid biosynthesis glycosyltransferase TuaH